MCRIHSGILAIVIYCLGFSIPIAHLSHAQSFDWASVGTKVAVGPDGSVYSHYGSTLVRLDPGNGSEAVLLYGIPASGFWGHIATDNEGNIYWSGASEGTFE